MRSLKMVDELAAFVVGARWQDISREACEALKLRILDSVGCAIGALDAEPIALLRAQLEDFGGAAHCSLIGGGRKRPGPCRAETQPEGRQERLRRRAISTVREEVGAGARFRRGFGGVAAEQQPWFDRTGSTIGSMIQLTSPAFADGETIPERFTCDGDDISPPLEWSGIPDAATELALLVEDPDAPGASFVHWVLFGLSPTTQGLAEGSVPPEAKNGLTSFGKTEYGGPCPPKGDPPHRYVFYLNALSDRLGLQEGSSAEDVRSAIRGLTVAEGKLTGTYGRS